MGKASAIASMRLLATYSNLVNFHIHTPRRSFHQTSLSRTFMSSVEVPASNKEAAQKSGIAQGRLMLGYCLKTVMIMGLFCVCYLVGPSLPAAHPHTQTHADARTVAGERGRRAVRRRGGGENATPCIAAAMSLHLVRWTLRI